MAPQICHSGEIYSCPQPLGVARGSVTLVVGPGYHASTYEACSCQMRIVPSGSDEWGCTPAKLFELHVNLLTQLLVLIYSSFLCRETGSGHTWNHSSRPTFALSWAGLTLSYWSFCHAKVSLVTPIVSASGALLEPLSPQDLLIIKPNKVQDFHLGPLVPTRIYKRDV
jgi:hypothetical protein